MGQRTLLLPRFSGIRYGEYRLDTVPSGALVPDKTDLRLFSDLSGVLIRFIDYDHSIVDDFVLIINASVKHFAGSAFLFNRAAHLKCTDQAFPRGSIDRRRGKEIEYRR